MGGGMMGGGMMVGAPAYVQPAPPPTLGELAAGVAVGMAVKAAVETVAPPPEKVLSNQMRQDERQIDKQSMEIQQMQRELMELKMKKD